MIPQLGVELGYQINCNWRAFIGYNVLYWGGVLQSGRQIDTHLDPRNFAAAQAGGLPYPAYPDKTTNFFGRKESIWAQSADISACRNLTGMR